MILFASDWGRYPTAQIDLSTSNKSFIRLASLFKQRGIKNHAFILALINPALKGVDPFSPLLTLEQMGAIALECKINPWYYFREVARAPAIGSNESVPLEANRGNIALFWAFFNHILTILIQIRQTGKSFSTDTLMTLLLNIVCENTDINLLTKDDVLRRKNIERLKEIAAELPRYLQQRTSEDANNGEEITVKARGNTYTTHVPQASPKRAYNMGRGLTSAIFHVDEGPFQPNIEIALPAALAATGAAVDRAKAAGSPYGTILTTTAGKKDDKDGRFMYRMVSEAAVWDERFFDAKDAAELERLVRGASRGPKGGKFHVNITLNHRQLGKTDDWLRQKLEESLQTGDDANRDYFNMWTSGSQSSPLPTHLTEKIAASVMEVLHTDISNPGGYITRWYIPDHEIAERMAHGTFVLGMDTSDASGGDDISLYLTDVETMETIACGTYNETNLISFAQWVCAFLVKYKNITAIIERRSTGAMLLDYLLLMLPQHGEDPFKRLFNRIVHDSDEYPDRFREVQIPMARRPQDIYVRYKKHFGFATSGSGLTSRSDLYSTTLQNAAKRSADRLRDKSTIDQILGLVTRNGRVDHEVGEHDDLVIGWLLTHWLVTVGKNLSFYGIDSRRVMSSIIEPQHETFEEVQFRLEQQYLRQRIEEVAESLSREADEYIAIRLETELRLLDKQIVLEAGEIYSVDELIRSAREMKRNRIRSNRGQHHQSFDPYQTYQSWGMMSDRPMGMSDFYHR